MATGAELNAIRVLRGIWLAPRCSRQTLAKQLGLDKSTITTIVARLIKDRLVQEVSRGPASSKGGRKPVHLEINKNYGCVLGIDVKPYAYTLVVLNLGGEIIYSYRRRRRVSGKDLPQLIRQIWQHAKTHAPTECLPVLGVGVGTNGIVDHDNAVVRYAKPLDITSPLDVRERVAKDLDCPLMIENDANCCAWAELVLRRNQSLTNFMYVLLVAQDSREIDGRFPPVAVGLSFAFDGKVYRGSSLGAGAFRAIGWRAGHPNQFTIPPKDLARIWSSPKIFDQFAAELSGNLALLTNALDVERVFVGGLSEDDSQRVVRTLRNAIQSNWSYPFESACQISHSELGNRAIAHGAAGMFLTRFFQNPEIPAVGASAASRVSLLDGAAVRPQSS